MKSLLPHPFVSGFIFVMWLLLSETMQPGPALIGAVVALLGGWALALLKPAPVGVRRLRPLLRLTGKVIVDILRSNIGVARVILGQRKNRRAGFVHIPLALRNPNGLAVLACILTATPGTAWLEFDAEEGWLLLHVLDLIDEDSWVDIVKNRYEQPLMEIFA